ncbi:MAG: type III pantothenate kinase [Gallionellaceae bacterium]|jgi:type III pantothenate kinase
MLLFDAGNSRCKWAWIEAGSRQRQGVLGNADAAAWQALHEEFSALASPHKILLSNVAGPVMALRLRELCAMWQCPLEFISAKAEQCGVHNGYDTAAQLGSDRWAALLAAWDLTHGASLVVNCGTATTVDALSEQGEFMGGLILPGLELMRLSLLEKTALLDFQNGDIKDFPRNSADAIASGVLWANIGAIQHQYRLLSARHEARCILSGGAAKFMLPYLDVPAELLDDLVLRGLQLIGQGC